jgi:hypothetical protein
MSPTFSGDLLKFASQSILSVCRMSIIYDISPTFNINRIEIILSVRYMSNLCYYNRLFSQRPVDIPQLYQAIH